MTPFALTSPAFSDGDAIPRIYTCDGDDISLPLAWSGVPLRTESLALIIDDPDAPDPAAPKTTWVHWVLYNIPPSVTSLPARASPGGLPAGTGEGLNGWDHPGYRGPCPPVGRHRYFHKLFALDTKLPDLGTPTSGELEQAMAGHVLASVELLATYQRLG